MDGLCEMLSEQKQSTVGTFSEINNLNTSYKVKSIVLLSYKIFSDILSEKTLIKLQHLKWKQILQRQFLRCAAVTLVNTTEGKGEEDAEAEVVVT